ncbi:amidohydrolase family protein [Stemphylium lycopersici]|nr:amidohydrolase family protein [Stemphylium lycopersici]
MSAAQNTKILTNARCFEGGASKAESQFQSALIIQDGKISFIGSSDAPEIQSCREAGAVVQDLGGKHVLPGFIDAHMHFLMLGQSLHKVDLDHAKDLEEIRSRISKYAQANPDKPRIMCKGWMHSMTNGEAKASMLDDLDPRPIYVDSKDIHSCWCNSAALKEMGIQDVEAPAGGTIERDEQGNASGLLSEACVLLIVWPYLAKVTPLEDKMAALRTAINAYHAVGCTGCIDMAMDESAWEAILALQSVEGLPLRVAAHWCIFPGNGEEHRLQQVERAIELNKKYNNKNSPDLRIVGIKIICDGVIDACTAALAEPYTTNGHFEGPIWTPEMLDPVVKKASESGLQCALHAIGDQAVHNAVNVLEKYGKPGQRHRIEHLELTAPEDAKRLGRLGITASIQPVHSDPAILRAWPKLLGPERVKRAFAYSDFADHGATLAIGSDTPTAPYAPLPNLYVATTRKSARQPDAGDAPVNENFRLELAQAVTAVTEGAAFSSFSEDRVGSLKVGKMADFCVVDMEWKGEELLKAKVMETWFEGKKSEEEINTAKRNVAPHFARQLLLAKGGLVSAACIFYVARHFAPASRLPTILVEPSTIHTAEMLTNRRSTMMVPPNRMPSWHPHSKGSMPQDVVAAPLSTDTEAPQSRTPAMLTSTSSDLPGHRIIRVLGAVHGTTSATRKDTKSFIKNMASKFSSTWGEAKSVTSIVYQARDQAIDRLVKEAISRGANAVFGLDIREAEILGCVVVSVSGTAAWVKRDSAQDANPFQ